MLLKNELPCQTFPRCFEANGFFYINQENTICHSTLYPLWPQYFISWNIFLHELWRMFIWFKCRLYIDLLESRCERWPIRDRLTEAGIRKVWPDPSHYRFRIQMNFKCARFMLSVFNRHLYLQKMKNFFWLCNSLHSFNFQCNPIKMMCIP